LWRKPGNPGLPGLAAGNKDSPPSLIPMVNEQDYQRAVAEWYESLYAFGYSLTGNRDDACELTQETYSRLLVHGDRVRDPGRIKSWLFTTAYRIFLGWKER